MSLGIVVKGSEGIVLAADSRVTLTVTNQATQAQTVVNFDNATKLLTFAEPHTHVAAVTYGEALIGSTMLDRYDILAVARMEDAR